MGIPIHQFLELTKALVETSLLNKNKLLLSRTLNLWTDIKMEAGERKNICQQAVVQKIQSLSTPLVKKLPTVQAKINNISGKK